MTIRNAECIAKIFSPSLKEFAVTSFIISCFFKKLFYACFGLWSRLFLIHHLIIRFKFLIIKLWDTTIFFFFFWNVLELILFLKLLVFAALLQFVSCLKFQMIILVWTVYSVVKTLKYEQVFFLFFQFLKFFIKRGCFGIKSFFVRSIKVETEILLPRLSKWNQ